MWDLPGPGLEPVSPALAGGFLTTAPPGKPWLCFLGRSIWRKWKGLNRQHRSLVSGCRIRNLQYSSRPGTAGTPSFWQQNPDFPEQQCSLIFIPHFPDCHGHCLTTDVCAQITRSGSWEHCLKGTLMTSMCLQHLSPDLLPLPFFLPEIWLECL